MLGSGEKLVLDFHAAEGVALLMRPVLVSAMKMVDYSEIATNPAMALATTRWQISRGG